MTSALKMIFHKFFDQRSLYHFAVKTHKLDEPNTENSTRSQKTHLHDLRILLQLFLLLPFSSLSLTPQSEKNIQKDELDDPFLEFFSFKNRGQICHELTNESRYSRITGFVHAQVAMSFIDSSLSSLRPSTKARKFGLFFIERIMKFCCSLLNIAPSADSKTICRISLVSCQAAKVLPPSLWFYGAVLYVLSHPLNQLSFAWQESRGKLPQLTDSDFVQVKKYWIKKDQKSTNFVKSSNPFKSHTSAMQRPKCREKSSVRAVL